MIEDDLRSLLRKAFPSRDLDWVEPSRGSSVGLPDVTINPIDVPVELKIGHWYASGFKFTIRPSQIRYHRLASQRKKRTSILIAIPNRIDEDKFTVWALPGGKLPRDGIVPEMRPQMSHVRRVYDSSMAVTELRAALVSLLSEASRFWK